MNSISVVIACRNEAAVIGQTLQSLEGLTDDIVVYDNGSTDGTLDIIKQFRVHLHEGAWGGFGWTKNKANSLAKYDWILSLDADEVVSPDLKKTLTELRLDDNSIVYEIKFRNFFGNQWLKHGEWGNDKHTRLFNRQVVQWDEAGVHEMLIVQPGTRVVRLEGSILHYTATDIEKYKAKLDKYAVLNGRKYFEQGKRPLLFKKYGAAFFSFVQNYIFRAGFLDGKAGYQCARLTASYTFKKYRELEERWEQKKMEEIF